MKLTRGKRIALELLGPPALGALLLMLWILCGEPWLNGQTKAWQWTEILKSTVVITGFAYFFGSIPSAIYAFVMEGLFSRGLDPGSWRAVHISTLMGTLSGIVLGCVLDELRLKSAVWIIFGGIGLCVGLLLSMLIKHGSKETNPEGETPP